MKVRKIHLSILLGIIMASIVFLSCDKATSILEGDQYKEKDYSLNPIDTVACNFLSDTLSANIDSLDTGKEYNLPGTWSTQPVLPEQNWVVFRDTQWVDVSGDSVWEIKPTEDWILVPDSSYLFPLSTSGDTSWVDGRDSIIVRSTDWDLFGDKNQLATVRDNLIHQLRAELMDSLIADTVAVKTDRKNVLVTPASQIKNLAAFENPVSAKYVIYVSDYLDLHVLDAQANEISTNLDHISTISTAGCYEARVRQEYQLAPGKYFIQANKNDQTEFDALNMVILKDK